MKKVILAITMAMMIAGCMTSNFALTGRTYKNFPMNHPVKVILTDNQDDVKYEEIGVLQVIQSDMNNISKAIELAKHEARKRGGDMIKLISNDSTTSIRGNVNGIYSSREKSYIFIVCRMQE